MTRRYFLVEFNPWDRRSYTYHCDDPAAPLKVGAVVIVPTMNKATGELREAEATVCGVDVATPTYFTRALIRVKE